MKITPIDIQQVSFGVRFRGYNRKEVDNFLDLLAHDYEMLIKESQDIKEKTASLEIQVMELKKKEATLNSTLIAVQKVVDEMKQNAQKEVDLLIKEAELKAYVRFQLGEGIEKKESDFAAEVAAAAGTKA